MLGALPDLVEHILFVGLTLVLTLSTVAGLGLDKLLGRDDPKRHMED